MRGLSSCFIYCTAAFNSSYHDEPTCVNRLFGHPLVLEMLTEMSATLSRINQQPIIFVDVREIFVICIPLGGFAVFSSYLFFYSFF